MARHLLIPLILVISLITLTGCETGDGGLSEIGDSIHQSVDKAVRKTTQVVEESMDGLGATQMAQDEFNKLYAFEYHVEAIFLPTTAADLSFRLNELGKDKWECGHPIAGLTERVPVGVTAPSATPSPTPNQVPEMRALIVCKRRPASYLRMLHKFAP